MFIDRVVDGGIVVRCGGAGVVACDIAVGCGGGTNNVIGGDVVVVRGGIETATATATATATTTATTTTTTTIPRLQQKRRQQQQ